MALRVAFGVIIASLIQTRNPNATAGNHASQWYFFPDWYYLGGLNSCAVYVIFCTGRNIGGTIRESYQAFIGVGVALVYNIILFSIIDVHPSANATIPVPENDFVTVHKSFTGNSYFVNERDFYTLLPCIMIFTTLAYLFPMERNTRKFAVANNIYFSK